MSTSFMNLKNFCLGRPALLLVLLTLAGAVRGALPPAENLLPADTFFMVTVPDMARLRQISGDVPQVMLWNDAAMKPFHDKFMSGFESQFIGPLEHDLGVSLADYYDLPQGQITFAITRSDWDGQDEKKIPGFLLLVDTKDHAGMLKTNLDALQQKWTAAGKSVRTETIHGIPFSIVPMSSNDIPPTLSAILPASQPVQVLGKEPEAPRHYELVIGQYQSMLIAGDSVRAVEPVMSRLTGGGVPCLADDVQFASDKASQFRDLPVYYAWFNAHALFSVLAQIPAAQPNPDAPTMFPAVAPSAVLNATGLLGLRSASLAYHQSHEGTFITFYLAAPEAGRQGLLKMIATDSRDAAPPAFVPADAVKFWRWRLDGQKIWSELQKSVGGAFPGAIGSLNGFIDMANSIAQQKDPSFDLRKNFIANLGDDWLSYDKGPAGTTVADLNRSRGIFLFAAENPEQTLHALTSVASFSAPPDNVPATQNFLGHTIHVVPMRPQALPNGETAQDLLYCSISGGYVAMSTDLSVLQEYLRSAGTPPRPLTDTPGFAEAVEKIGGMGTGLFGYQDHRVVMRAAFGSLKQSAAQAMVPFMPKSFSDWIDFSLLPDYDQVSKYFYFSVFNGTTTPDGILFKGFTPRPPQLN